MLPVAVGITSLLNPHEKNDLIRARLATFF